MTNKEWIATLPTEKAYEILYALFFTMPRSVKSPKEEIIEWLDEEQEDAKHCINDIVEYFDLQYTIATSPKDNETYRRLLKKAIIVRDAMQEE